MNTISPYVAPIIQYKNYSTDDILTIIAEYYRYPVKIILSSRKFQTVSKPRHIATYLISTMISSKLVYLAETMQRDNNSIQRSIKRCIYLYKTDKNFQLDFDNIIDSLDITITMRCHIYKRLKF
jgi:chromosomal replication initiation ATPase DnaA